MTLFTDIFIGSNAIFDGKTSGVPGRFNPFKKNWKTICLYISCDFLSLVFFTFFVLFKFGFFSNFFVNDSFKSSSHDGIHSFKVFENICHGWKCYGKFIFKLRSIWIENKTHSLFELNWNSEGDNWIGNVSFNNLFFQETHRFLLGFFEGGFN